MPTYRAADAQVNVTIQEVVIPTTLTVFTDKTTYAPGETVQVSGSLKRDDTGATLDGMSIRGESSWGEVKTAVTGSAESANCLGVPSAPGAYCMTMTAPAATGSHVISMTFSQTQAQALAFVGPGPMAVQMSPAVLVAGGLALYLLMGRRRR